MLLGPSLAAEPRLKESWGIVRSESPPKHALDPSHIAYRYPTLGYPPGGGECLAWDSLHDGMVEQRLHLMAIVTAPAREAQRWRGRVARHRTRWGKAPGGTGCAPPQSSRQVLADRSRCSALIAWTGERNSLPGLPGRLPCRRQRHWNMAEALVKGSGVHPARLSSAAVSRSPSIIHRECCASTWSFQCSNWTGVILESSKAE